MEAGALMIRSMTGFGRCENTDADHKIIVEIKTVNHRYSDISIKMPKKLSFFESSIRTLLKKYVERGKVDVFITYEDYTEHKSCLKYNADLAREYMDVFKRMQDEFGIENDVNVSTLSRCPEVLILEEQTVDEEALWKELEVAIIGACENLVIARNKEGEQLREDLIEKLDAMAALVDEIARRSPQIITEYRARLTAKVKELLGDNQIDETRIALETTLYADKLCVDEEIVRLRSHIETTKKTLLAGGSIGRKLDFIAQEMNREANTILSKANDLMTSDIAINLKTNIEKVREQIQNIE